MPAKQRPLAAEDLYALQFVEDPQISPDGKHIAFVKVTIDRVGNKYHRAIWLADLTGKEPRTRQFTSGIKPDTWPRWSPDGKTLAFVSARSDKPQIYLIGLDGGEARAITSMPNGATNPVWSPDGKHLAFLSRVNAEERANEDSGQEDPPSQSELEAKHRKELKEEAEKKKADPRIVTHFPYRTGVEFLDDRRTHVYVMDTPGENDPPARPYRISDGDMDFTQAFGAKSDVAWTPDGKFIITTQSRDADYDPWFKLGVIRLAAGGKRKPFTFLSQPGHDYYQPGVSPDGQWIAARRRVDNSFGATGHLAILPVGGGAARDLTAEFDRQIEVFRWAADSRSLYVQAGDRGDIGVYRVRVGGGGPEKIIGGRRMVQGFTVSARGDIAFLAHTPERPEDLYLFSGGAEKRLTSFNDALLSQIHIAKTEAANFTAPDGRPIQGWLLKPIGFKKGEKYPLAVNMHGGPHVMWGPAMPGVWFEWQLHAARGYAVFYCNPRGSDGYGEEFATLIQNDWGDHVMTDILAGVDRVAALGFVDARRLALTGGSYAGYMTAWIVGHDDRFACAWSQRGLYSLLSFYGATDIPQLLEREFEVLLPSDDLEKSWRQSPLAYVRNIKTPLAIEHQENDYRCPISEGEQLYAALKRLRREVVFYRYPREGHEMSRAGEPRHRVDRLNRMVGWFDRYCMRKRKK